MKKALAFIFILMSFLFFPLIFVEADMGPKPMVSIKVEGIQGRYTAALAAQSADGPNFSLDDEHLSDFIEYHPIMEYKDDEGFFWITKYWKMSDSSELGFYYYPPSPFKLIIMLEDETIFVSQVCTRYAFESLFTVNVDITKPNELLVLNKVNSNFINISNIIIRLVLTIIIELVLLLLFNIKNKRAILVFIMVNIVTQLFLNIALSLFNYYDGSLVALAYYFFIEILIFTIETIIYIMFFKNESKFKLFVYSLMANALSFFVGILVFINFLNV